MSTWLPFSSSLLSSSSIPPSNRTFACRAQLSPGRGNVDHVLVGPGGLFAIETKSHRGRIPLDRLDEKMSGQAYAEKKRWKRSPP
ncbi:MAG: nuclease-related domain-containing protein [Solirubrobacterales bacterium]